MVMPGMKRLELCYLIIGKSKIISSNNLSGKEFTEKLDSWE